MSTYQPTSGVYGRVGIAGYTLAVDHFGQDGEANVMEAPSFPGANIGYMEHCVGMKKTVITFGGTWNAGFNPFANGIKLGRSYNVALQIIGLDIGGDGDAIVQNFRVTNSADGKAEYTLTLVGDFIFSDFSGGAA